MIKPGTIGYVPPPHFGCAKAFLHNVRQFKTKYPVVLYSDHDYGEGIIKLKSSPEIVKNLPGNQRWSVNNFCFFTGLRIAQAHNLTHVIYLESDVRVRGDNWDHVIFDEYFNLPMPCAMAGTTIVWNPANSGMESLRRWERLVKEHNSRRNVPIACYGYRGSADRGGTCVFANGAGAVYDLAWLTRLYDLNNTKELSLTSTAWDQQNGMALWKLLGINSYDAVGYLSSIYSGYGDVLTTQEERLEMLRTGGKALIHQVKDNVGIE